MKLEIKLKQHTPLINFQYDQEGATLRASEVKPKLDKFLLEKLGKGDYNTGCKIAKESGWIIGKEDNKALDYKIRIEASDIKILDFTRDTGRTNKYGKPIKESIPLFFGDLGADDNLKKMTFCTSPIKLTIVCSKTRNSKNDEEYLKEEQKEDGIINLIKKNISLFFILHNFGTRQSKGFGCFTIIEDSHSLPNEYAEFSLNVPRNKFGTWDFFYEVFDAIDLFHKTIRSGINQNEVYLKSLMYFYAIDQDSYWDKRTIRYKFRHFTPNIDNDKGEKVDKKNDGENKENIARLYRDMLGLSSSQTWMSYNKDTISKENECLDEDSAIERFKSPLLFKPIYENNKFHVLIIPTPIPNNYLNAIFKISSSNVGQSFEMRTPNQFDTKDFLSFITDENITNWVIKQLKKIESDKKRTKQIKNTLISIYSNINYIEK